MKHLSTFMLIFVFLFTSCTFDSKGKSTLLFKDITTAIAPIEIETDQAYLKLQKNLFKASCTKCHNAESAIKKDRLDLTKKKLILENYDDILYRMTDAFDMGFDYMPEEGGPVSALLIEELKAWKTSLDHL